MFGIPLYIIIIAAGALAILVVTLVVRGKKKGAARGEVEGQTQPPKQSRGNAIAALIIGALALLGVVYILARFPSTEDVHAAINDINMSLQDSSNAIRNAVIDVSWELGDYVTLADVYGQETPPEYVSMATYTFAKDSASGKLVLTDSSVARTPVPVAYFIQNRGQILTTVTRIDTVKHGNDSTKMDLGYTYKLVAATTAASPVEQFLADKPKATPAQIEQTKAKVENAAKMDKATAEVEKEKATQQPPTQPVAKEQTKPKETKPAKPDLW